jgi:hypothetical protein
VHPIYETRVDVVSSTGVRSELDLGRQVGWIPTPYRDSFLYRFEVLIALNPDRPDMVHQFWEMLSSGHNTLGGVRRIVIYRVIVSTTPGSVGRVLQRAFVIDRTCPACQSAE